MGLMNLDRSVLDLSRWTGKAEMGWSVNNSISNGRPNVCNAVGDEDGGIGD